MPDSPPDRTQVQVGSPTVSAATAQGFPAIAGYTIVRELGRGGMGVVYEARQLKLDRTVALKLMKDDDPLNKARFLAEGQVIAAVKHPHVVAVYDFGESVIGPFIAMEYLTGGGLADRLRAGVPPREVADLMAKVAAGVGAAHDQGIVHRDLKPGNVLLAADGTPKVTDFGLAKRAASELTRTQDAAGTPAYMAPEQARAMKFVGPPADVWSLGVMLYEALAGKRPFVADTDMELLIRIQNDTPTTLRALTKGIPPDLETICLKCLEKEPERRYANATELAADLTAWTEGRPIAARRATTLERVVLWVRRKPMTAAAWVLGLLVLMLGGFTITTTNLWQEAVTEKGIAEGLKGEAEGSRDAANAAKLKAEASEQVAKAAKEKTEEVNVQLDKEKSDAINAKQRAEIAEGIAKKAKEEIAEERGKLAYARNIYTANVEYDNNNLLRAKLYLGMCTNQHKGWEYHHLYELCNFEDHNITGFDYPTCVCMDAAGKYMLIGGLTQGIQIWSVEKKKKLRTLVETASAPWRAAISKDGTKIATIGILDDVTIQELETGKPIEILPKPGVRITCLEFNSDASLLLLGSAEGPIVVWDLKNRKVHQQLLGHSKRITSASFSTRGSLVVTGSWDETAKVWDLDTGDVKYTLDRHRGPILSVSMSRLGTVAVTGGMDRTVKIWGARTGNEIRSIQAHAGPVLSTHLCDDGEKILTCSWDGIARLWNTSDGKEVQSFKGHQGKIFAATCSANGEILATAGEDKTIKIWNSAKKTGSTVQDVGLQIVAVSKDCGTYITEEKNKIYMIRKAAPQREKVPLEIFTDSAIVALSDDGKQVAVGYFNGRIEVYKVGDGRPRIEYHEHKTKIHSIRFSANARLLVSGDGDGIVKIWNVDNFRPLRAPTFKTDGVVTSIAINRDCSRISTGAPTGDISLWEYPICKKMGTFRGHSDGIVSSEFSDDGTMLLSASFDKSARLWSNSEFRQLLCLSGHSNYLSSATFSLDSTRIVTCSSDSTVKLWDFVGNELVSLYQPDNSLVYASFGFTNDVLSVFGREGRIRLIRPSIRMQDKP